MAETSTSSRDWRSVYEAGDSTDIQLCNEHTIEFIESIRAHDDAPTEIVQVLIDYPAAGLLYSYKEDGIRYAGLIHHLFKLSSPAEKVKDSTDIFGIQGLDGGATDLVKVDPETLFPLRFKTYAPHLESFFQDGLTGEELLELRPGPPPDGEGKKKTNKKDPGAPFAYGAAFALPPFLLLAFSKHDPNDFAGVIHSCVGELFTFAGGLEDSDLATSFLKLCFPIVQGLWLNGQDVTAKGVKRAAMDGKHLPCTDRPRAFRKCAELERMCLRSTEATSSEPTDGGGSPFESRFLDILQAQSRMQERLQEAQTKMTELELEKRSTRDNITAGTKKMALLLSASEPDEPAPTQLSEQLQLIIKGSKVAAEINLKQHLLTTMQGNQIVDAGKATLFHSLGFVNPNPSHYPGGLSPFFTAPASPLVPNTSISHSEADYRKQCGGLTDAQIKSILSSKLNLADSYDRLLCTVKNLRNEIKLITTDGARLRVHIDQVCKDMDTYADKFCSKIERNTGKEFIARFVTRLDELLQNVIRSCAASDSPAEIDWESMEKLGKLGKKVSQGSSLLGVDVPPAALKLISGKHDRDESSDNSDTATSPTKPRKKKKKTSTPVKNRNINPAWKLKANENYQKVFSRKFASLPKINNIPLCGGYHVKGECHQGEDCPRKATHGPVSGEPKAKMDQWVAECRATAE